MKQECKILKKSKAWIVYIIECSDQTLYTGITTDLSRRIQEHEAGTGAKYTKGRGPFKVLYTECCQNRSSASKRELVIKKLSKKGKLTLVNKQNFYHSKRL